MQRINLQVCSCRISPLEDVVSPEAVFFTEPDQACDQTEVHFGEPAFFKFLADILLCHSRPRRGREGAVDLLGQRQAQGGIHADVGKGPGPTSGHFDPFSLSRQRSLSSSGALLLGRFEQARTPLLGRRRGVYVCSTIYSIL